MHLSNSKESIFYNIYETLSYNCLFNLILGERGNGKGYACKTYGTKMGVDSLCTSQFGYIRRRQTELDDSAPTFFEDIKQQFNEHHFKYKGGTFYCDDKVIGYAFALSTFGNIKSIAYPNVDFLIYDEFIVDEDMGQSYLRNEVQMFYDLYETVARPATRGYSVPVFFIANRISDINPYFVEWRLEVPTNKKGVRVFNGKMLVQLTQTTAFRKQKMDTEYYKMLADAGAEKYIEYAVNNEALRDTDDFIRKAPSDGQYRFTLRFLNRDIAVYYSYKDNLYYVSHRIDSQFKVKFTTEPTLHTEGCTYIKRKGTSVMFNHFLNYFQNSLVWYSNKETKYVTLRGLSGFR